MHTTRSVSCAVALLTFTACAVPDAPTALRDVGGAPVLAKAGVFPDVIPFPVGFGPEGIAVGDGHTFYAGSLTPPTFGQIIVGDLRTGEFTQLVAPSARNVLGMKYDSRSRLLFAARGPSGAGTVHDATTGAEVAFYQFGAPPSVINDVALTRDAAYFTDSQLAFLYRVALGGGGEPGAASAIALPANFAVPGVCPVGPRFKQNGIAASPNGKHLILTHMTEGRLYRFDTETQALDVIDLGGGDVCSVDGLLLDGRTLYAVQNFLNKVAVIEMSPDLLSGSITRYITEPFASNPNLKVPATIAEFGNSLYAVTAGFAPPAPDFLVRLPK